MRLLTGLATAALVAGCSAGDAAKVLTPTAPAPAVDSVTQAAVVQGSCPKVELREGTAYFTTYAKGGDNDPSKIVRQASITDTTRQCRTDGTQIIMTVQATGRVVAGPAGGAGDIEVPIRVVAMEGETVLYSELQKQVVSLPQGQPTAQFLFTNAAVTIPATSSSTAKVMVGFDPGPYNTP